MILLVLLFCLANGTQCVEKQDFQRFALPMACAIVAQQAAAEWIKTHPAYVLRETRCELEERKKIPA